MKTSYNQLTHQIRHSINADYEKWCEAYCDEIEALQRTHQTRSMHKKIKVLLKGSSLRDNTTVISSKDGKILTTDEDVKNRWREYCSDLYDHKLNVDPTVLDQLWANQPQEPIPDILESEIKSAILRLSNGKAMALTVYVQNSLSMQEKPLSLLYMKFVIELGQKKNFQLFGANQ